MQSKTLGLNKPWGLAAVRVDRGFAWRNPLASLTTGHSRYVPTVVYFDPFADDVNKLVIEHDAKVLATVEVPLAK